MDHLDTQQLINEARLIIASHHDGVGDLVQKEAYGIRHKALMMAGFDGNKHTEEDWDEWIPKLPSSIKATMIELSDALDCHDTTRYM